MTTQRFRWVFNNKLLLIFLATLCLVVSTGAQSSNTYRLPKSIIPKNYTLKLLLNLENKTYDGEVNITLQVLEPVKIISLHSKDLDIKSVEVSNSSNNNISIVSTNLVTISELLQVNLQDEIKANTTYELHITFSGRLDNGIVGLYESTLRNGDHMIATAFEPTYARQSFPCFDEPDFKATYKIIVVKPSDYVVLSNMNQESNTTDTTSNTDVVTFATSVPMSTYLVCVVVGKFDALETEIDNGGVNKIKILTYAQKNETDQIKFSHDIGVRAMKFYIDYYNVTYPLPKMGMVAIPDYRDGATEQWGLITFRESQLLVTNDTGSPNNKIVVGTTVTHEIAHMWFGNLVTMKWWSDLWLNEGFASYMQFKSLNAMEPTWSMSDRFLTRTLHSVLVTDAKLSSHPIVQTVETPDQISEVFDSISYSKGASILRMCEGFLTEKNFRSGVQDYLKKYAYGNTVTNDFFSSMVPYFQKDNPDRNLTHIMDTWTRQMGFPVLSVKPGDKANTYVITQTRFLANPDAVHNQTSEYNYRWFVPITYKTNKGSKEGTTWLPDTEENITLTLGEKENWLKMNNDQVGYYRVLYTEDMWQKLTEALKNMSEQLTVSDRAHLLNDVFTLAEAKAVKYSVALKLSTYLKNETDFVPWDTAYTLFPTLSYKLLNTTAYNYLQTHIQSLIKGLYDKQNWENNNLTFSESSIRAEALAVATYFGLPTALDQTHSIFLSWLNSTTYQIDPSLRNIVYFYGMKSATEEEWERFWQRYLKEEDIQEKSKLRYALSAPNDVKLLKRYMDLAWDENNVRSQDYLDALSVISNNPVGIDLVWDHIRTNWTQLVERFNLNNKYLGRSITYATRYFNTEAKLKEMQEFFAQYPDAGAGATARADALETVQNNIKWIDTFKCRFCLAGGRSQDSKRLMYLCYMIVILYVYLTYLTILEL